MYKKEKGEIELNSTFNEKAKQIKEPTVTGSYVQDDCVFLLKDISEHVSEEDNELREEKMKRGYHYSEMLPKESYPTEEYLEFFQDSLKKLGAETAQYVADVSEMIVKERGRDVILVSLARAGTPVGVLIKRYVEFRFNLTIPHYSISIIRGKGLDENALLYIINKHKTQNILFVDGWTGKGAIGKVLKHSVSKLNEKFGTTIQSELAVLADPANSAEIYGTREDFLLPNSCLNSIVSGLVSRTVHRDDLVGEHDFHGAKYYTEWENDDLSRYFVDEISKHFSSTRMRSSKKEPVTFQGWDEILRIQQEFGITDINKIKPSIGETTRVLLRRVPWKILIKNSEQPSVQHLLMLAKQKNVEIIEYPNMSYSCIGLIKE